jgi:hypothetical protein
VRASPKRKTAWLAAALLLFGCGGEGTAAFKKAGPPAPKRCIKRWNQDETALGFGRHAYFPGHDSRAGHVFAVRDPKQGLSDACVVVFAAKDSDREYGTLGWFSSSPNPSQTALPEATWQVISYYPADSEMQRIKLQRTGAEQANVALTKDGTIAPL